jgi:hypothetical protein
MRNCIRHLITALILISLTAAGRAQSATPNTPAATANRLQPCSGVAE